MSINLELSVARLQDTKTRNKKVQYVPATIKGDGPADVETYFDKYSVDHEGTLKNSFRGYPLLGCEFPVPDPYKGFIFQETDAPLDENASRVFKFAGSFNNIKYFNYDKMPTKADPFLQIFDVVNVAETMCTDIPMAEIEKRVTERKGRQAKLE